MANQRYDVWEDREDFGRSVRLEAGSYIEAAVLVRTKYGQRAKMVEPVDGVGVSMGDAHDIHWCDACDSPIDAEDESTGRRSHVPDREGGKSTGGWYCSRCWAESLAIGTGTAVPATLEELAEAYLVMEEEQRIANDNANRASEACQAARTRLEEGFWRIVGAHGQGKAIVAGGVVLWESGAKVLIRKAHPAK